MAYSNLRISNCKEDSQFLTKWDNWEIYGRRPQKIMAKVKLVRAVSD